MMWKGLEKAMLHGIKADKEHRKEWLKQRRCGMKLLGFKPRPLTPAQRLKAMKHQFRADGYHPAPKYGKGEWVHEDCTVRSIRHDPQLGWYYVPSVSWMLLCRAARKSVAARTR